MCIRDRESIAPAQTAESWDNVGVLVRCAQEVTGVLCALDITPATVREARAVGCNAIVSHHPVIFRPLKELRQDDVPALDRKSTRLNSSHRL